ncbi:copper-translocating P-type ATPase [Cyphellophora europaea CBS 101466]|uniref:Copper-translocating P-type ATPase n=1 Tax=Cyphellophora europaea (strain CBS 101466) TaxID=1220924 RepID=W2S3H9_CYPE1|nr:copper-translocating P-type ATPase [Cyphellophora europaea CBS 101466]ETN43266.1 copper-translocating P-type ATPase [Cyphellophora europaea CBS 101466]
MAPEKPDQAMKSTGNPPCGTGCCGPTASLHSNNSASTTDSTAYCDEAEKCDEVCIKAAAALECKLACDAEFEECSGSDGQDKDNHDGHDHLEKHGHKHDEGGHHPDEPCVSHIQAAMDRYAAYLESARCICRSAIESSAKASQSCATVAPSPHFILPHGQSSAHSYGKGSGTLAKRTRTKPKADRCYSSAIGSINGGHDHHVSPDAAECHDHGHHHDSDKPTKVPPATSGSVGDIEKMAAVREHVLFNVTGMDCSGCANNLTRALAAVPGTDNVKVTFITNTAELDLDSTITAIPTVVRLAERATGYKLVTFDSDNQVLDLTMDSNSAKAFQSNLPAGAESCTRITGNVYEVNYDPCMIRARDVLEYSGGKLAPPRADKSIDAGHRRLLWVFYLTAAAFILTMPVVVMEWGDFDTIPHTTVLIISVVLGTLVQCIAYPEFYKPAISSLIYNRVLEMDMLVVISITAAYGYSIVASGLIFDGRQLETSPFFETSTLLITLVLMGRLLAAWARKRAVSKVSLRSLQASTAVLVDPATGSTTDIDARLLHFGDTIQVLPHSQVVTDADVVSGISEVDESMLTGESLPIHKAPGSSIISGTVNGSGTLTARVVRLPGKNTITDIANLVEQAQSSKPRIQDLADKVAGYFIPVVCTAAVIVFAIWLAVSLRVRNQAAGQAIGTAISYCIAVLAVSCPCALGLAVPMVLVVAGGIAAQGGIIIKTADVTERGHKVTDVIFDKTGTLTEGNLDVVEETVFDTDNGTDVLSVVKALVKDNKHPVSVAVAASVQKRTGNTVPLEDLTSIPGCGMYAMLNGTSVRAGNSRWLGLDGHPTAIEYKSRGLTLLCVTSGEDKQPLAIFGLKSALRPEAHNVVAELHRRGLSVHILSGDSTPVVAGVATTLGIPLSNVAGERSPAEKQAYVSALMSDNKTTLFCGDGTNDAVAVAQASVGVQIESTSDVTRSTADVVLLGGLDGVVSLLDVSKAAYRRILFNFAWSAVYNVLAVLLAGGAFVRIRIPPAFAGLGEVVSVMPVVVAALTMPKVKKSSISAATS